LYYIDLGQQIAVVMGSLSEILIVVTSSNWFDLFHW
jgi:hypothetical protein